ncbi:hypothetical protein B0H14DRAFT_2569744 [Mycena olivaceomarginata]|nr:hypothetical protein B0H14DRAFT_2569744 [Mycena olivaceomarginata]
MIVTVKSLLYISLFTTMLAALLALLGKQWVMYYRAEVPLNSAGSNANMFPLLLQLALLLFSVALWGSKLPHSLVWRRNADAYKLHGAPKQTGSGSQTGNSHFQSPLVPVTKEVILKTWWLLKFSFTNLPEFIAHVGLLPIWVSYPDYYLSGTSTEVPAVVWMLETSTDPMMVTAAAEMVIDLQWPLLRWHRICDQTSGGYGKSCNHMQYGIWDPMPQLIGLVPFAVLPPLSPRPTTVTTPDSPPPLCPGAWPGHWDLRASGPPDVAYCCIGLCQILWPPHSMSALASSCLLPSVLQIPPLVSSAKPLRPQPNLGPVLWTIWNLQTTSGLLLLAQGAG